MYVCISCVCVCACMRVCVHVCVCVCVCVPGVMLSSLPMARPQTRPLTLGGRPCHHRSLALRLALLQHTQTHTAATNTLNTHDAVTKHAHTAVTKHTLHLQHSLNRHTAVFIHLNIDTKNTHIQVKHTHTHTMACANMTHTCITHTQA